MVKPFNHICSSEVVRKLNTIFKNGEISFLFFTKKLNYFAGKSITKEEKRKEKKKHEPLKGIKRVKYLKHHYEIIRCVVIRYCVATFYT